MLTRTTSTQIGLLKPNTSAKRIKNQLRDPSGGRSKAAAKEPTYRSRNLRLGLCAINVFKNEQRRQTLHLDHEGLACHSNINRLAHLNRVVIIGKQCIGNISQEFGHVSRKSATGDTRAIYNVRNAVY
jgi:hypothetical protein